MAVVSSESLHDTFATVEFTIPYDAEPGTVYDINWANVELDSQSSNIDSDLYAMTGGTITVADDTVIENPYVSISSAEGLPGETVRLNIDVACNNKFECIDSIISWDSALILASNGAQEVKKDVAVVSDLFDDSCTFVAYSRNGNGAGDGIFATIDFAIPADAEPGTVYNIYFSDILTFADIDHNDLVNSVASYGGTITVTDPKAYASPFIYVLSPSGLSGETVTLDVNYSNIIGVDSPNIR